MDVGLVPLLFLNKDGALVIVVLPQQSNLSMYVGLESIHEIALTLDLEDLIGKTLKFRRNDEIREVSRLSELHFFSDEENLILLQIGINKNSTAANVLHENFNTLIQACYIERCPAHEPFLAPEEGDAPAKKRTARSKVTTISPTELANCCFICISFWAKPILAVPL
ncbi:hypothetical protein Ccrd_016968 [Cynara cardunculus var. scolymus]|uniref:Uncharacterized protein n=1 Tax=Cynara cardunculus var. scolymus TaxID=59895 RepID=A0A124SFY9_CYNCS|nr:hypothetical protein Ccrd_016968 [Cynara cardunculus var. scolymus]